jgi:outer membrane protein insertion porin family
VVLRESRLKEGEWLSYQGLLDTQTALAGTGLFSNVAVREIAVSERARTLVIEAQEAPLVTIVPALGYSERNKLRASADVSRRNVSGLGRSTALFGRVSIRGWRALASFTEPYAFGRRQAVTFQTFAEDDQRDAFSFRRFGAQAQTLFPLPLSTTLLAQYTFQRTRTRDVQTDCAEIDRDLCDGDISGPTFGLLRDTRNDAIDPRRGSLIQFEVQGSARFVQGDPFLKATASFARYAEVRRGLVIASGIRLGAARAYGGSMQIPVSERFFAGGDSSLRGFETDRLGPLRNNDLGDPIPVGGNALAILSVEARADLTRYFGAQAFLETGGLFARVSDARVSGLRQVAGLGVRYRSPVGPIRVEYAWILDRRVGEDRGQLHVGLGYAF